MAIEAKRVETRSWGTDYRGWVAILSSKRYPLDCKDMAEGEPFRTALANEPAALPLGMILCLAELKAVLPTNKIVSSRTLPVNEYRVDPDSNEYQFGNYEHGRAAWVFRNCIKLQEPIACKGALGLFSLPQAIEEKLIEFLTANLAR